MELGTAFITLLPSTRGFQKAVTGELQGVERAAKASGARAGDQLGDGIATGTKGKMGAIGGVLKAGLIGLAAGVGAAVGAALGDAIGKASALEQSIGGVQAVFKEQAAQIETAAKSAATNLGMTRNSYNELATTLGAGLKNKGIEDFAGQTQNLIGLGADLAAQFGGSTTDAVSAITSLMRGEADPIERFGVAINETAVNAELAARGQDKLTGSALESAKAQARLDLLFKQTADAQGAFARESDTFAGKQARAAAQWEDLTTKIGERFLPVLTDVMGFVSDKVLPGFEGFASTVGGALEQVGDGIKAIFEAEPNPEIAAAFEGVRDAVDGMWRVIQPILLEVWELITQKWAEMQPQVASIWGSIQSIIENVMTVIGRVVSIGTAKLSEIWNTWGPAVLGIIDGAMTAIGGLFDGLFRVIDGIWQTLAGLLTGDTEKMKQGVLLIFDGLATAAKGIFDGLVRALGGIWDGIKNAFAGPVNWVIDNVINALAEAVNKVAETFGASFRVPLMARMSTPSAAPGGGARGGAHGVARAFAGGGQVPGWSPNATADNIPIWATAGEYMIRQSSVRKLQGKHRGLLDYMNATGHLPPGYEPRGYAGGGRIIPNATQGFRNYDPGFLSAIQAWAAATGRTWSMTGLGGARSYAQQAELYRRYLAGTGPLAANPAKGGPHMYPGRAMDLSPRPGEIAAARALLAQFGLGLTVPGEPWHVGDRGASSGGGSAGIEAMLAAALAPFKGLKPPFGGEFAGILGAIPGKLIELALSNVGKLFGFDSGGWLQPGLTLAYNGTSRPEPVLTSSQWEAVGPSNRSESATQMPSVLVVRDVDGALIGRMRVEARGVVHETVSTARGL